MDPARELASLVAEHATWLSAMLRGLTRSEADAEDAFQDVWARVLRAGGIPAGARVRAYLATVARSAVVDRYRRTGREELLLDEPNAEGETAAGSLVDARPLPSEQVDAASLHECILAAVRALPRGPRETAMMRIEGELKFQEIAEALQVPLGTVLTWMRTATARIRQALEECHG